MVERVCSQKQRLINELLRNIHDQHAQIYKKAKQINDDQKVDLMLKNVMKKEAYNSYGKFLEYFPPDFIEPEGIHQEYSVR